MTENNNNRNIEQEIALQAVEWRRWETQYEFEKALQKNSERAEFLFKEKNQAYDKFCKLIDEYVWSLNAR